MPNFTRTPVCPKHSLQDCPLRVVATVSLISQFTDSLLRGEDQTWVLEGAQESIARRWKDKRLRQTAFPCRAGLGHKEHSKALALLQGGPSMSPTSLTASRSLGVCRNSLLMLTTGRDMFIGRCWQLMWRRNSNYLNNSWSTYTHLKLFLRPHMSRKQDNMEQTH